MTTAQLPRVADDRVRDDLTRGVAPRARIRFRQPVSTTGFVDAAWWPYTSDLTLELPALMDVVWTAGREINRITYQMQAWSPAPRRMRIEGRTVRLGGFATSEPHLVRLSDPWRYERIDILLVAPDTDAAVAQRIFDIASTSEDPYRA
ncbi:MAG: hypothetical protein J0H43_01410, partial [Actinobacteria bacterium]|nr:hypothetical protein [Actinomycetota bacterium]